MDGRAGTAGQHHSGHRETIGTDTKAGPPETARAIAAALRTFREMKWRSDRHLRAKALNEGNPLAPDGKGGFKKMIPAEQSSGQLLAAPSGGRAACQSIRHADHGVPGLGTQPITGTRGAVLRDRFPGSRPGRRDAHHHQRIFPSPGGRHRPLHSNRGRRRPAGVREAQQARVRETSGSADLTERHFPTS